ncbi:MAG: haloacid dehalogenase-like hydrolase [Acidobacteriota bacterium]
MHKLILFDIDGTLITDGGAARRAFGDALALVYEFPPQLDRHDFSGKTDPQIAFEILRDAGFDDHAIHAQLDRLWSEYLLRLEQNTGQASVRTLPGVASLITQLEQCQWATLALLTGNLERGARLKLTPPDLNRHFPFGAFGSDSMYREELPPVAAKRARTARGHEFRERDIVIIGDSVFDVRCGVPHGATTVAVASGRTSADLLRAEQPTWFFDSLENNEAVIRAIGP